MAQPVLRMVEFIGFDFTCSRCRCQSAVDCEPLLHIAPRHWKACSADFVCPHCGEPTHVDVNLEDLRSQYVKRLN